jgi:hypothetical protein
MKTSHKSDDLKFFLKKGGVNKSGTYKGNNKITELRTILQRESQNS